MDWEVLTQKMTSSGLSDHIQSANHFFKGLYMKYSKMVFQSFIELKVALFIYEKEGTTQNQFKTLLLNSYNYIFMY